jgi:AraC-like DNA-binding protein
MTALEFLRSESAQALLRRSQIAAGVPVSLHYLERNQEGPKISGWGQCEACEFVSKVPGGKQACRQSRQTVSSMALRQGRPLPFVCHLGLSCVSVPALKGEGFVLTFGPYCPAEEARSLPFDTLAGLNALLENAEGGETHEALESFPVSLADIHRSPATAIPELAAWTAELLQQSWKAAQAESSYSEVEEKGPTEIENPVTVKSGSKAVSKASGISDMVAVVAARDYKQARTLLKSDLLEAQRGKKFKADQASARAIAVLAALLEGLETSSLLNPDAWEAWPAVVDSLREAEELSLMLDEAVRFMRQARVKEQRTAHSGVVTDAPLPQYEALNKIITASLPEHVTLNEVARELGETPSAITHRLQRKFGMSYSEYIGRLRVDQAKDLLRRTQLSATEVARRVGVRDQSNFGKMFKKYAGMTPLAYRKQYGRKT